MFVYTVFILYMMKVSEGESLSFPLSVMSACAFVLPTGSTPSLPQ